MKNSRFIKTLRYLASDEAATVLVIFAFVLPAVVLASLVAIDFSLTQNTRVKVQASVDAAILAASAEANKMEDLTDRRAVALELSKNFRAFFQANLNGLEGINFNISDVSYDADTKRTESSVTYRYPSLVRSFTGAPDLTYEATAVTHLSGKERNSLSMMLVLDKSGSMGWRGRMNALKKAVNELAKQFHADDPDENYIRVGAVAYDSRNYRYMVRPTWGPNAANRYTQRLRPGGGTNSSGAVRTAYMNLRGKREERQHAKRNKGELRRVILFMTDGANNRTSYDSSTLYYCRLAKREKILVYTVAFQAPSRGQRLLKFCATSPQHYFQANDADELVKAFKIIGEDSTRDLAISG
ncbi:MAG: vWA domain-containing protein [Pseudomonadota bacterium]